MADIHADYRWDTSHAVAALTITVTGRLLADPGAIPAIIDRTHALVEACEDCHSVVLVYDLSATDGRLPLSALMGRAHPSPKVKRVVIVGARARSDEMAVLIMAAAKQLPYGVEFVPTLEDARPYLADDEAANLS